MDPKELMMIKMENQINPCSYSFIPSDQFSSVPPLDTATWSNHDHQKASLGFMELLGFQDFTATKYSIFDHNMMMYHHHDQLPPSMMTSSAHHPSNQHDDDEEEEDVNEVGEESSVVLNVQPPSSPNASSLSSPHPATVDQRLHQPQKQCMGSKKITVGGDEAKTETKKKKEREARFAFMTRTEIDHLDDGYRWRKYGQKAVKNSPFPRSYYRCTSASCNVKKRVERCMGDPSFVVTTYEGQHIHPTPTPSANAAVIPSSFNYNLNNVIINPIPTSYAPAMMQGVGLLQDMLSHPQ